MDRSYDFIVLLNGKDSCHTRIAANYTGIARPKQIKIQASGDTIPFFMRDSRLYLMGHSQWA